MAITKLECVKCMRDIGGRCDGHCKESENLLYIHHKVVEIMEDVEKIYRTAQNLNDRENELYWKGYLEGIKQIKSLL